MTKVFPCRPPAPLFACGLALLAVIVQRDEGAETLDGPEILELPVRIVDANGQPVVGATVTPWALRSSQGHGTWSNKPKDPAGVIPKSVVTDKAGEAAVAYPRYRNQEEQTTTLSVSLNVDQPGFAYESGLHIDVPLDDDNPYTVMLKRGVSVDVRPLIDGEPTDTAKINAFWSDGRSWQPGAKPEVVSTTTVRIPAMPPGDASLILARLDGDRVTHFSRITDFELTAGEPKKLDVPMPAALRVTGRLSDNVPRPIKNGRIKVWTLKQDRTNFTRASWFTWTPVATDGTFTIDAWPAGEAMQLIAFCEGYLAESGTPPDVVEDPRDPATDPFCRPQVFTPTEDDTIQVKMTPLVPCKITAVDQQDQPIAGVTVMSWPNVGWWNGGSQIYCDPLVRGEDLLRSRSYLDAVDKRFQSPFQSATGEDGQAKLMLPAGKESLAIQSDDYELPVFLGRRSVKIELVAGDTTEVTLRLQPRGLDRLGEWDKLAGVVFGCSTREGRRICALPGVRERMDEFTKRFREAKNQRDPKLLSEAYFAVADAFIDAGDPLEANKWQFKALEQKQLAEGVDAGDATVE